MPKPSTDMTEALIHVCIVCDLYYKMRNHLIENEGKLGEIVKELIDNKRVQNETDRLW